MATLKSESVNDADILQDVRLFQCCPLPLTACLGHSANVEGQTQRKSKRVTEGKEKPKWKQGFEEQCELLGKVVWAFNRKLLLV